MDKLILEKVSPNVKKIINIGRLASALADEVSYPVITPHANGVIEFEPKVAESGKIKIQRAYERCRADHVDADVVYDVNVTGFPTADGAKPTVGDWRHRIDGAKSTGSTRFCTMSNELASWLTSKIKGQSVVDIIPFNPDFGFTATVSSMVNVSKYFRIMEYHTGGEHYPHYDSDYYVYSDLITKYSVVLYLTDNDSGELIFANSDPTFEQGADWPEQATEEEIIMKIKPKVGKIVLFPHTLCHGVLPLTSADAVGRVAIRGDIIFKSLK